MMFTMNTDRPRPLPAQSLSGPRWAGETGGGLRAQSLSGIYKEIDFERSERWYYFSIGASTRLPHSVQEPS